MHYCKNKNCPVKAKYKDRKPNNWASPDFCSMACMIERVGFFDPSYRFEPGDEK